MAYLGNYITSSTTTTTTTTTASTAKSTRTEIEFLFHKILSPISKSADPNLISQLCHKITDLEHGQHLADLIVTKLTSSQEWEVLIALCVMIKLDL